MKEFGAENFYTEMSEVHKDFKIISGKWVFNKFWTPENGKMGIKVRAGFDDLELLDGISFSAKIAINNDPDISNKYVIFIYGSKDDLENLTELAKKFPYAELIKNTSSTGKSRESSDIEVL